MTENSATWDTLDWSALDRLRDTFLAGKPSGASYWSSLSDLANYDFSFARRIGWKWDAVLRELKLRGWTPPKGPMLDWGCGSGIAGRRVVEFFGEEGFECLRVFDRSPLAMEFAREAAREAFPSLRVESYPHPIPRPRDHPLPSDGRGVGGEGPDREFIASPRTGAQSIALHKSDARSNAPRSDDARIGTLVVSHVLNELDGAGGHALRQVIDRADAVLWVEPGTRADSRSLIELREALRETFHVIAPCTHQGGCGLRTPENERHWCHHFAAPPAGIMANSNWVRFAQRAGIDLRSLPYSFLVLERRGLRNPVPGLLSDGWSRIIGEPRFYKGYAKIFNCRADGVRDLMLQKRDAPELFKALKDNDAMPFQQWGFADGRIKPS